MTPMIPTFRAFLPFTASLLLAATAAASPQEQASFDDPTMLSEGATPGGAAFKGKLLRLTKTPMGVNDGRLVAIFGDAASTGEVWDPKGGQHMARDLFVRYSDDNGVTWTAPVNISNTAGHYSARTDWNGDGQPETYWGDSEKPNAFSSGNTIVISWIDAYVPEATVAWGTDVESTIQGESVYADAAVYPNVREVPYKAPYVAISYDGGATFEYGVTNPPIQLTYGRRDAKQDVQRGAGTKWAITWQEDPEGLQQGSGEGPGTGASGAKVTKGTDIWYSWVDDITASPLDLRTNRTPLSNQSEYDMTGTNGYPINPTSGGGMGSGGTSAGSIESTGCSRGNMQIVKVGQQFFTVVAYEETKGVPIVEEGKTIQYHSFLYNAPVQSGSADHRYGDPGTQLSPQQLNSRRVRFVAQPPNGTDPAIAIFWKQGLTTEGGPSDIFLKVATAIDAASVAAAPALNMSTNTPNATTADMALDSETNPIEDANAHRAVLRGPMLVLGWCYTWNGPLARYTDLANYNFYVRRTIDGGATWDAPQNLSNVVDTTITVREPRLVGPAKTGTHDPDSLVVAWGTETNVYEGIGTPESLDTEFTRTRDQGATWEKVVPMMAASSLGEFESQIRVDDPADNVYAVVMTSGAAGREAFFTHGSVVDLPTTVGTIVCIGDGTATDCPCGNDSPTNTGAGCANSTGAGGLMVGTGSASVAADDLVLQVSGLPGMTTGLLFIGENYGPMHSSGFMNGDGILCIGPPIERSAIFMADANGDATLNSGLAAAHGVMAGETRLFQIGYRDAASVCGRGYNMTNALRVTFLP